MKDKYPSVDICKVRYVCADHEIKSRLTMVVSNTTVLAILAANYCIRHSAVCQCRIGFWDDVIPISSYY